MDIDNAVRRGSVLALTQRSAGCFLRNLRKYRSALACPSPSGQVLSPASLLRGVEVQPLGNAHQCREALQCTPNTQALEVPGLVRRLFRVRRDGVTLSTSPDFNELYKQY
jgi:hypothetical protein